MKPLPYVLGAVIVLLYLFPFSLDYVFPSPDIIMQDFALDEYFLITDEGSNPGAPVVIVEFLDYQCPFCLELHPNLKKVLLEYPEDINYVVRHLPSPSRPFARKSAEAAECAKDQGKFFSYQNKLLEEGVEQMQDLYTYAEELEFSSDFVRCLQSGEKIPLIEEHIREAALHNVRGTPILFVNGRKLEGVQTYATLKLLTEAIIKNEVIG